MKNRIMGCYLLALVCVGAMSAMAVERAGEAINWQVISSGGIVNGTSTHFMVSGTIGQTAVGSGSSTSYAVRHGFWQNFGPGSGNCCLDWGVAGDANDDLVINLLDILQIIQFVYQDPVGDPPNPHGCNALLDSNGDGPSVDVPVINLLDILAMIDHVYVDPVGTPAMCCPPGCQIP
ncbi:MAG: hypothetical protein JW763_08720 [candidate division Zixibacteria bacterium]|nr:hypothetical protein [candidate division Zixibacteria bacterium]